jgi:hypothetical protein
MHADIRAAFGSVPGAAHCFAVSVIRLRCWVVPETGMRSFMTDDRTERRAADLLPEERVVGSADPEAQAEAILSESDEREADVEAAPDSFLEHRRSGQTVTPGEGTR